MADPDLELSYQSTEYVKVPLDATVEGISHDPTADTVELAFTAVDADPVDADWVTGSWETIATVYHARALVGPAGDKELERGRYWVWVKITDSPEIPVLLAGTIEVI